MAKFRIALNMEYCRSADKSFEAGLEIASEIGYEYVEPMVHTGWELLSEANYFHSFSLENDGLSLKALCDKNNLKVCSLSAHSPLMKPEAAIDRLTRSIIAARDCGAKFVNTDEGIKPEWMDEKLAFEVMRYSLTKIEQVARRYNIIVCIEPHGVYTKTSKGLMEIVDLVKSPFIQVNWDTGNSYIAGAEDPYVGLENVKSQVYHIHAKDIAMGHSEEERGHVTGTPVGCACGEGVIDWVRVAKILEKEDREIFLSVECGTIEQAKTSLKYLNETLKDYIVK